MNQSLILKIVGVILCIEALCMAPSLLLSIACGGVDQRAFLYALLICGGVGVLLSLIRARNTRLQTRDGFVCVALCWIVLSVFGALPYFLSGSCGFVDAIFETVSGLTTTGASIFSSPSSLPRGLQLWRALTQWMGGIPCADAGAAAQAQRGQREPDEGGIPRPHQHEAPPPHG